MNKLVVWFCVGLLLAASGPAWAKDTAWDLELQVGYVGGDNTYEIGGKLNGNIGSETLPFPISQLEFPLNAPMLMGELGFEPNEKWRVGIRGGSNIGETSEKMKDSDWFFGFGDPNYRVIYSHSDTDLRYWDFDAFTRYTLLENTPSLAGKPAGSMEIGYNFFMGLGFRYQDYHYDVHNLRQWYPLTPWIPIDEVRGLVLKYDLALYIPYAELGFGMKFGDRVTVDVGFAFSVFVHGEDEDQHLLRDLVGKMDSGWDGQYLRGNIKAKFLMTEHWFASLLVEGSKTNVDGTSFTNDPAVGRYTIDQQLETNQACVYAGLGYSF